MWHAGNHYWGMHLFWWLFWIIICAAFISFIFTSDRESENPRSGKNKALDILQQKYASGEITTEEYRERKKILEEG